MNDCLYFQAYIDIKKTVYFVGLLRSLYDHFCFDRTLESKEGLFEFYLVPCYKDSFVSFLEDLKKQNIVLSWKESDIHESYAYLLLKKEQNEC